MSPNRPRRLAGFSYRGKHAYLLTICTHHRARAFEDHAFAMSAAEQLLQCATERDFALPAWCLMPDHVHLLPMGRTLDADLRSFVLSWNTRVAFEWRREHACRLWQTGYYDRVPAARGRLAQRGALRAAESRQGRLGRAARGLSVLWFHGVLNRDNPARIGQMGWVMAPGRQATLKGCLYGADLWRQPF
jgi:REP element-mobilizing transposase RayT